MSRRRLDDATRGVGRRLQGGEVIDLKDVRKVAVAFPEIQPIADDEPVRAIEADVAGAEGGDPTGGFVQSVTTSSEAGPGRAATKAGSSG